MGKNDHILRSWQRNAGNWIETIDEGRLESRKLGTNQVIVNTIVDYRPVSVLDLGCGEGWLTRALNERGIEAVGVDGTEALIENAKKKGGGQFQALTYEAVIAGADLSGEPFDAIVINFGLFLDKETGDLLKALRNRLSRGGKIFIQSIHPFFLLQKGMPYQSAWQENSWEGLAGDYSDPHQWYARTLSDWVNLFNECGLYLAGMREPLHPETNSPMSVIFVLGLS